MDNAKLIRHVIVLMLENRSFDQMLGDYRNHDGFSDLEGIDRTSPIECTDQDGYSYSQSPAAARCVDPDPPHELDNVLRQLGLPAPDLPEPPDWLEGARLQRFLDAFAKIVDSYREKKPSHARAMMALKPDVLDAAHFINEYAKHGGATTQIKRQEILNYFPRGSLPALHQLADNFLICDHWFSSVPGPTWANRFFVHTGTSCGVARMAENVTDYWGYDVYDQDTIFDRLSAKSIPWRIYFGDIPQSVLLLNQAKKGNISNYCPFGRFEVDVERECEDFPAYVFIEPSYKVIGNDDHPPHDVHAGQNLIATVYNAIHSNDKLWRETLLVVTYDEHGGFYDHVPPPEATSPGGIDMKEWTFDSLGLRVPAVLISPYVSQGIFSEKLEHSSLLRFLIERFDLEHLTDRTRSAGSFASAITSHCRPKTPESLPLGAIRHRIKLATLNELQKALVRVADWAHELFSDRKYFSTSDGAGAEMLERSYTAEDYQRASADFAGIISRNT